MYVFYMLLMNFLLNVLFLVNEPENFEISEEVTQWIDSHDSAEEGTLVCILTYVLY